MRNRRAVWRWVLAGLLVGVVTPAAARGAVASAGAGSRAAAGEPCAIVAVRDAATLRVHCGAGHREVLLPGIVAPRGGGPLLGGEPFGDESRDEARRWLVGRRVVPAGDSLWLDGADVRVLLLARGLAQIARGAAARLPPALATAERSARERQLGIWSHAAWSRHQAAVTRPMDLPTPPPPQPPSLGRVAARHARHTPEQRRAAFDAAIAALDRAEEDGASPP